VRKCLLLSPIVCQISDRIFSRHHSKIMFIRNALNGQGQEIFSSVFLHESVSPNPLTIPLGPLRIFLNICGDIYSARSRWHRCGKWKKSLIRKVLNIYFIHLWVVELTWIIFFLNAYKFYQFVNCIKKTIFHRHIDTGLWYWW